MWSRLESVKKSAPAAATAGADSASNYCLDHAAAKDGWLSLYTQPPRDGERTLEHFSAITLRRVRQLVAITQAKHRGEEYNATLEAIKDGAKHAGQDSVYQWFDSAQLRELMRGIELEECDEQGRPHTTESVAKMRSEAGDDIEQQVEVKTLEGKLRAARDRSRTQLWRDCFEDDSIAHYAARLAFCGDERSRKWFLEAEETLFRGRLHALSKLAQTALIDSNGTGAEQYTPPNDESSPDSVLRALQILHRNDRQVFFRVRFTAVPRLVRSRRVIMRDGWAILSHAQVLDVLCARFRAQVEAGLVDAQRSFHEFEMEEHDRLCVLLRQAQLLRDGTEEKVTEVPDQELIPIEDIGLHAERNMPLCMRQLDRALRRDRHLKFHGRWQYGVFLKRVGLKMEELLRFYGEQFSLKGAGGPEKFAKSSYGYSVRHWYGMEGKKTSYTASNCATIVNGTAPAAGQCHGCPYRHSTEANLRALLREPRPNPLGRTNDPASPFNSAVRLSERDVDAITKKALEGHYTAACHMYFKKTHAPYPEGSSLFASPFEYWAASREWVREKLGENDGSVGGIGTPDRRMRPGQGSSPAHSTPGMSSSGAGTPSAKRMREHREL